MTKSKPVDYIKLTGLVLTLLTMLVGSVVKFNLMEQKVAIADEKVSELKDDVDYRLKEVKDAVEEVDEEQQVVGKNMAEFSVEQRYIKESVDEIKDLLKGLSK